MGLPEYIKSADELPTHVDRQRTPKTSALMKAILPGLKNPLVYQKCLEENQDTLKMYRVIEIATDIYMYDRDCQRSIMQTVITGSAAATAIQQGSTPVHKLQEKRRQDEKIRKET